MRVHRKSRPRKYRVTLLAVSMIAFCFSGCGEDYCPDECTLDRIIFFNLSPDELNTVQIQGYEKDGSFSKLKDTTLYVTEWVEKDTPHWEFEGMLSEEIDTDLDYLFVFPEYGKQCRITDINVIVRKCGFGLFERSQSKSFDGYYVNDGLFACQILKVFPEEN